tara:strand:- start:152 stop:493 length:342 start_codon:yes stop_codon:yes gene_type:complete
MDSPSLCDKNRLSFNVSRGEFTDIVYAISIDGKVKYIGKTNDFGVRVHTYRNAKYWKNAWISNKRKTKYLETAVRGGKQVEFYCLECESHEQVEKELIEKINPPWNKIYCNPY